MEEEAKVSLLPRSHKNILPLREEKFLTTINKAAHNAHTLHPLTHLNIGGKFSPLSSLSWIRVLNNEPTTVVRPNKEQDDFDIFIHTQK